MYIYKTTNLINNKIYIGINNKTVENSKSYYGSGTLLKVAIEKYGKENFSKEILERDITDRAMLLEREIYWIAEYGTYDNPDHYNQTKGGDGSLGWSGNKMKKNSIISDWLAQNGDPEIDQFVAAQSAKRVGSKRSAETKAKMSIASTGRLHSDVTKTKMSISQTGVLHTAETKAKIAATLLGKKRGPYKTSGKYTK